MRTVRKEKAKKQAAPRRIDNRRGFPTLPSKAKPFDVVGLGENSVDTVAVVARFPAPDSKQVLEVLSTMVGGQIATALVAVARLGFKARYLGGIGDDDLGRRVRGTLAAEGVRSEARTRKGVRTRGAIVLVDRRTGARTILEDRDPRVALRPSEVEAATVASGRVLLIDARDPAISLKAARLARAAGVPVVLDVERAGRGIRQLLRAVDVIVTSADFPREATAERNVAKALASLAASSGAGVVIATRGSRGSVAWVGGRIFRTVGFRVKAVDTTGAGDAFRGGLIAGWLAARAPVEPASVLEYANAVAALNCCELGAQAGLPSKAQVAALVTRVRRDQSK
jgi:sulfofructose kinase